jgi:hypothetical protein
MTLYITNEEHELELGKVQMTLQEFIDVRNHPYIATSGFEYAVIDLDESIPAGYLRVLGTKVRIIPKMISEEITNKIKEQTTSINLFAILCSTFKENSLLNKIGVSNKCS